MKSCTVKVIHTKLLLDLQQKESSQQCKLTEIWYAAEKCITINRNMNLLVKQ